MGAVTGVRMQAANESDSPQSISPISKEVVIGLVGYAGAGCSTAANKLHMLLHDKGYRVEVVKLSHLIEQQSPGVHLPKPEGGPKAGAQRLARARQLQDLGDRLRENHGNYAVAALAARRIKQLRGASAAGEQKIAFIIESIKHRDEVDLLRQVYDLSFRLIAVHCERPTREKRLIGNNTSSAKYHGVPADDVLAFMERDEKDGKKKSGQGVRDAFYLADYFIDNNLNSTGGENLNADLERFLNLLLGAGLVRPTADERAIYHAYAASLQSSCLSRQVGAALLSKSGELIATGTNDVPKFGGGVYDEASTPDHRCHAWVWDPDGMKFQGCHNDRRKATLREDIGRWLAANLSDALAEAAYPPPQGLDNVKRARDAAVPRIREFLASSPAVLDGLPGIKDLIEYSRAIHAEMSALLSAARSGVSPVGGTLYCTTYPCHSCARHLITAGVSKVLYIEPYVKSLASELHSDAITNELPKAASAISPKMVIVPFTGVGPRMYEDFFVKRGELKAAGGVFAAPAVGYPSHAVRLKEMAAVEDAAAALIPGA